MSELSRRGFLGGILAGIGAALAPRLVLALGSLDPKKIKAEQYKNQYCLRIVARNGESYASISKLYTGSEKYTGTIRNFNDNKPFNLKDYYYIPYNYVRKLITDILSENKFSVFEIDEQGEEQGIGTLFDIATNFLNDKVGIAERIDILLVINTDVNPINKIVYPGQQILVPDSLVKQEAVEGASKPETQQPAIRATPQRSARQNPFRTDVSYIRRRIRPRDRFGASRIRGGRGRYSITKHTGLDLVAPIGTPLYPIETGTIIAVSNGGGRFWRNGKSVKYKTNSGLEIIYIHLSSYNVKAGQKIDLKTMLGRVGITGNASADNPHVHIQVKTRGKAVNPEPYIVVDS